MTLLDLKNKRDINQLMALPGAIFLKIAEGSTKTLVSLCFGYFLFYVITGITIKYFLNIHCLNGLTFLVYSSFGCVGLTFFVVIILRWYRLQSINCYHIYKIKVPKEIFYIIASGIMCSIILPSTTLMYTLPISVMVAMVIMRGAIIVICRIIDAIQIYQGILTKKVYLEENLGVIFAILAISVHIFLVGDDGFDFLHNMAAMLILSSYISAYFVRIYILNYYKNTRPKGLAHDNKGFLGIEQITSSFCVITIFLAVFNAFDLLGHSPFQVTIIREAILVPSPHWPGAVLAGVAFGFVSFFAVFIFLFKGRTATFTGLVTRLTSLIAGTTATVIFHFGFGGKFPKLSLFNNSNLTLG